MRVQVMKPELVQQSFLNNFVADEKRLEAYVLASPSDCVRQMPIDVNRRGILAVSSNVGDIELVADPCASMKGSNDVGQNEVTYIFRVVMDFVG